MHGDAAEVEEDLSKVEWGAGLARLITAKFPNLIFFCLGWSTLALPTYLLTGLHETALSHAWIGQGTDGLYGRRLNFGECRVDRWATHTSTEYAYCNGCVDGCGSAIGDGLMCDEYV